MKRNSLKFVILSFILSICCFCLVSCKDDNDKSSTVQETVPVQVFDKTINFPKVR